MKKYTYPSVMTIAGFDGSGGAGIQADIKTISALGCFATSALTALPVQNTCGVRTIYPIPTEAVREQIDSIMEDIFPDVIKIGMVHSSELVQTIVRALRKYPPVPVVFDPVMVAASGDKLIEDSTISGIIEELLPLSAVITPNLDEAAILADMPIRNVEDMYTAGKKILSLGCPSVLLKGGHLDTPVLTSLFLSRDGDIREYKFTKYDTNNIHGAGCTLSSAIAAYIARGHALAEAVSLGQEYVHLAILHGKDVAIGKGNGPLNHFFDPVRLIKNNLN